MKFVIYKNERIAKGSKAFELWLVADKSKDPKDWKSLDKHMKQINQDYKDLHYK